MIKTSKDKLFENFSTILQFFTLQEKITIVYINKTSQIQTKENSFDGEKICKLLLLLNYAKEKLKRKDNLIVNLFLNNLQDIKKISNDLNILLLFLSIMLKKTEAVRINFLIKKEGLELLASFLHSEFCKVEELIIEYRLKKEDLQLLLSPNDNLYNSQKLSLLKNLHITSNENCMNILETCSFSNKFTELQLPFNRLSPESAIKINTTLINNPNIQFLNVSCNLLGSEGIKQLFPINELRGLLSNMLRLDLSNNKLTGTCSENIYSIIANNFTLLDLNLNNNLFGDEGIERISKGLDNNCILQNLSLQDNKFTSLGVKFIYENLINNNTLKKIDLSNNTIDIDSGILLASMIKQNEGLESIYLDFCQIGPKCMEGISHALIDNRYLKEIYLKGNKFKSIGFKNLSEAIKENSTLKKIDVSNNNLGIIGADCLSESLEINRSITEINLASTNIDVNKIKNISEILKNNESLTKLNLSDNYISKSKDELKFIDDMLKLNKKISDSVFLSNRKLKEVKFDVDSFPQSQNLQECKEEEVDSPARIRREKKFNTSKITSTSKLYRIIEENQNKLD
jgi:Ran GTPase-activating protein (RanGAP) involved in mRNA processing and transport